MKYCQYPVHATLKNYIRYFWSYDMHTEKASMLHIRSFADCYPRLIYQDLSLSSPIKTALGDTMPVCYLSGMDTKPSDGFWESRFSHFGVSFYPHALHTLFRIDASELINETPNILALHKTELPNLLIKANNHGERVSVLTRYFYDRLYRSRTDLLINNLLHQKHAYQLGTNGSMAKIASEYKISERQLQRRFKQNIGVTASKFSRVNKFEQSLQLLPSTKYGGLTQLAYNLGYADQSHFINDFKAFSGITPYDFITQEKLGAESSSFIYENDNI